MKCRWGMARTAALWALLSAFVYLQASDKGGKPG